jgi:glycosyltransferase involved in cell wall biosynthesis
MSNGKPLVSVITVVYNGENLIEETIKSVLSQSYNNFEYIIIDGNSTDKTVDIIKKYEREIDRWTSEPDDGIYDAMNKGIGLATGDIIGILNSGDLYFPNTIKKIVKKTGNFSASIFTGNIIRFIGSTGTEFIIRRTKDDLKYSLKSMPINHPATFVGKEVYKEIGLFDTNFLICADNEFVVRAQKSGVEFIFLDEILAKMELGGVSEKINSLSVRTAEHFKIRKRYGVSTIQNVIASCYYFMSHFIRNGIKYVLPAEVMKYY